MIEISKAVLKDGDKYLLLKRCTTSYPGTWDFAGGKHDPGENAEESVVREALEETGYAIIPGNVVATVHFADENRNLLFHYFEPLQYTGDFVRSEDHSDHGWFTLAEIKSLELHPSVPEYFKIKQYWKQ